MGKFIFGGINAIFENGTFITDVNKNPSFIELYTSDDNCYYEVIKSPIEG